MPMITWGPQLELGIELIDKQHHRLCDLINELDDAVQGGRTNEVMGGIFEELLDYTRTHFKQEERLLTKHGYYDLDEHMKEHRIFTDQMQMYQDRFLEGSTAVTQATIEYLTDWLLGHIAMSDRAYLPTLRDAGVE